MSSRPVTPGAQTARPHTARPRPRTSTTYTETQITKAKEKSREILQYYMLHHSVEFYNIIETHTKPIITQKKVNQREINSIWDNIWDLTRKRFLPGHKHLITDRLIRSHTISLFMFLINVKTKNIHNDSLNRWFVAQDQEHKQSRRNSNSGPQGPLTQRSHNARKPAMKHKKTLKKHKKREVHEVHYTKYGTRFIYRFSKLTGKRYKQYI